MSSRRQKLLARVNWYLQSSSKHIIELITGNEFCYRGGRYRQVSLYKELRSCHLIRSCVNLLVGDRGIGPLPTLIWLVTKLFSALLALCAGNSPVKGQWHGALMFFICAWINSWVNNREAGELRRHHAHYDVTVMVVPVRCLKKMTPPNS